MDFSTTPRPIPCVTESTFLQEFNFMVYVTNVDCSNVTKLEFTECGLEQQPTLSPTELEAHLMMRESLDAQMYLTIVITLVLASFNALANGFSFFVFRSKAFGKSVMSRLLTGLSVYEVLFQLTTLISYSFQLSRIQAERRQSDYGMTVGTRKEALAIAYLGTICRILTACFQLARNWIVVSLSMYRYEAVCRATARTTLFIESRITYLLVGIGIVAFLLVTPRLFEAFEVICPLFDEKTFLAYAYKVFDTKKNVVILDSKVYKFFYLSTVIFIMQSGGPVIIVALLSGLVTKVLWERQKFRSSHNMRRSNSSDKLMIALAFTFFILETPAFFSKLLQDQIPQRIDYTLVGISNLCIYFDSTMNIFVYLISNPTFRKASLSLARFSGDYREVPVRPSTLPEESMDMRTISTTNTNNTNAVLSRNAAIQLEDATNSNGQT